MTKVCNGYYDHRGCGIFKEEKGYTIDDSTGYIYKTLSDCRQAINKALDSTNTKEPEVIGKVSYMTDKESSKGYKRIITYYN